MRTFKNDETLIADLPTSDSARGIKVDTGHWKAYVGGRDVISVLMTISLGILIYVHDEHSASRQQEIINVTKDINGTFKELLRQQTEIVSLMAHFEENAADRQEVTNYILHLDQSERNKLNLIKPKLLREQEAKPLKFDRN